MLESTLSRFFLLFFDDILRRVSFRSGALSSLLMVPPDNGTVKIPPIERSRIKSEALTRLEIEGGGEVFKVSNILGCL